MSAGAVHRLSVPVSTPDGGVIRAVLIRQPRRKAFGRSGMAYPNGVVPGAGATIKIGDIHINGARDPIATAEAVYRMLSDRLADAMRSLHEAPDLKYTCRGAPTSCPSGWDSRLHALRSRASPVLQRGWHPMNLTLFSIVAVAVSAYAILRPSFIGWVVAAAANAAAAWLVW